MEIRDLKIMGKIPLKNIKNSPVRTVFFKPIFLLMESAAKIKIIPVRQVSVKIISVEDLCKEYSFCIKTKVPPMALLLARNKAIDKMAIFSFKFLVNKIFTT